MSKETTKANKERRAATRNARLFKAAQRRASDTYTVPSNAVIPIRSLPQGTREKMREEFPYDIDEFGHEVMIPHPKRGKKTAGRDRAMAVTSRERQAERINRKKETRRRLAKMKPADRREARSRGLSQFVQSGPKYNPKHFAHCAPKHMRTA